MNPDGPTATQTLDLNAATITLMGELVPLTSATIPPTPLDDASAEFTIALSSRVMNFALAAPAILREPGILWFDVRPDGVEISAASELLGFTHETGISGIANGCSFGVSAAALASVVAWSSKYLGKNTLMISVNRQTGTVLVKPDRTTLTGSMPLESLLIDLTGATMFDDIDRDAQARTYDQRLPHWVLTAYFDRPAGVVRPDAESEVPFDNRALHHALADARRLVPRSKAQPGMIQLQAGYLYGGGTDLLFWYDVPTLAGHDLIVAREQLAPLTDLLALLPTSQPCRIAQAGTCHVFSNAHTRISLPMLSDPHPANLPGIIAKRPQPAVKVDAAAFKKELEAIGGGEADNGDFVFLHGAVAPGRPPVLQLESRNPRNGNQFNKGSDIPCEARDLSGGFNFLADHCGSLRALMRSTDIVSLQATPKSLYISGAVIGAAHITRTAKIWAVTAEVPAQLARQVRGLARTMGV